MRLARTRNCEIFCRLVIRRVLWRQVDFGESVGVIGGMRMKLGRGACFDLSHSDACFVKAYPAETTEAFLDGHVSAFVFFGGVPLSILYDNLKIAVARILVTASGHARGPSPELLSRYLFDDRFGRPGKGNDKGKVEALVKYTRANFLTPMPHASSFAALNATLEQRCRDRQTEHAGRHAETIMSGFTLIRQCFAICLQCSSNHARSVSGRSPPPPWHATEATTVQSRRHFGFRDVLVRGFVDEVVIVRSAEVVARHPRRYGRGEFAFDPWALSGAYRAETWRTRPGGTAAGLDPAGEPAASTSVA